MKIQESFAIILSCHYQLHCIYSNLFSAPRQKHVKTHKWYEVQNDKGLTQKSSDSIGVAKDFHKQL